MSAIKDLTGKVFNSLTVIERSENINGRVAWKCLCECGRTSIIRTGDLTTGHVKTCGKCDFIHNNTMYEFYNGYVIGHTKMGKIFYIDEDDLFKIKDFAIYVDDYGYADIYENGKTVHLSRILMKPSENEVVDHINRVRYDNRRSNLRVCTQNENLWNLSIAKNNKTGVTGVYYHMRNKRYVASICVNYKRIHLGSYKDLETATKVRKEAEQKYFGEFAPKNI